MKKLQSARLGAAKVALLAVVFVGFYISGCGGSSSSPSSGGSTPKLSATTCVGNEFSFFNNNSYPVWLAEAYQGGGSLSTNIIPTPTGKWKIAANGNATDMCMPAGWTGRFWPRTECHFHKYFGNDPGYKSCTTSRVCGSGHVCYGGKCMLKCNVDSKGATHCQNTLNSTDAICMPDGAPAPTGTSTLPGVCSYPQGTVCKTGDCSGLYQCYGQWGTLTARDTASGPVSLFEPTSNSETNINYDVSLVNGYNTAIAVLPSATPSSTQPANCYAPACTSDLNSTCPSNLQITEDPTSTKSTIPCGTGTYCRSGWCDTTNDMCVIGCDDPGDQCGTSTPPAGLDCTTTVPNSSVTYEDMYLAKNNQTGTPGYGQTMSSGNQGTATCWGTADCAPGETCNMNAVSGFPSGVGICEPTSGTLQPQTNCTTQSDVGNSCGGYYTQNYPNALGYSCVSIGSGASDVACVPAQTSGLGTLETSTSSNTQLYSGTASPLNPAWLTAAQQAGGGTAYYKAFTAACPNEYAWQYDDHSGGFDCAVPSGSPRVDLRIVFGLRGATATP